MKPTIALGMLVKNEEKDLPRLLASVRGAVDRLCIIDTGSTDDTMLVARECGIPGVVKRYTGASRKDATGDWKLEDFSKARNMYLDEALRSGCDWVITLDADDELMTPDAIRRASYWPQFGVFGMWIQDGGNKWLVHRLWKTNLGIKFDGRCHEYPNMGNIQSIMLDDCLIIHHGDPNPNQEDSNARNLRILLLEWKDRQSPRCAFYLANTHRDGGRWKEAAYWYSIRIQFGEGYRDEWLFAHLYAGRALRALKETALATEALESGQKAAPDWCEFTMELARMAYDRKDYAETIRLATPCVDAPVPFTQLWRERHDYSDGPARLISWCHEHMGNIGQALAWSEMAIERIGGPDKEWDDRHKRLRMSMMQSPLVKPAQKPMIALHRPGAIGDILMTLNLVPLLKAKYPDHAIHYYCADVFMQRHQLGSIILQAGVDMVCDSATFDAKRLQYAQAFSLVGYPLHEGYPNVPMRQHLLRYCADEMGLTVNGELPSLSLPKPPLPSFATEDNYITVQRHCGWSTLKEWPKEKWDEAIQALVYGESMAVVELDVSRGWSLADTIAVFANAKMHIGGDSFPNHLSNFWWTHNGTRRRVRSLILWGSTQVSASGYDSNVNISKGIYCQPCFRETVEYSQMKRGPCINVAESGVHTCMDQITVQETVAAARKLWSETK
jgi:glycosyltransferase involved in cell wall biosynthesis/ADP-heptose:LPS heptosyltransferase